MSCAIINAWQVGVFTEGDTYTHIRAGTVDSPGLSCDTVADLPAQAGGLPGYFLEQGSAAHVIADNTIYCLQSSGVWVIQDQASRMDVYTKQQTDTAISSAISSQASIQSSVDGAQDGEILSLQQILGNVKHIQIDRNTTSNFIGFRLTDNDNHMIRIIFGRLNSTTNYVQFYGGDGELVDKGYITFTVSRNVDTWSTGG